MSKQLKTLLSRNDKKTAAIMIKRVLEDEGIGKLIVDGFPPEAKLSITDLIDDTGWIGRFMLYSDEMSIYLTGKRIWDCYYIKDFDSIDSVKPIDSKIIPENIIEKSLDAASSYENISLHEDLSITEKYLYTRNAIISTLELKKNGLIDMKEKCMLTSQDFLQTPNGSIIPLRSKANITKDFLKTFFKECTVTNERYFAPSLELSSSINQNTR